MKGYGKTNESKQRSLQSEYFDTQNNNLDTEMYLKDKIKHVYANGSTPRVCYKKDRELQYSLNKLKILSERINKNDFLDRSRKEKKQDLDDLKKYISSSYELITTQQEYLELFYSKLEEQKCKIKILQKTNLGGVIFDEIVSPENNFEVMVKDHSKENKGQEVIATEFQTICSSETLHETAAEKNISNLEIINNDVLINVNKINSPDEKEEEDRLSEDGKRICLEVRESSIKNVETDVKDVSKKTNVIKNKNDANKRAVRKHLNAISAIIAGKRKAPKTGLKLYQVNDDGWISVKHTFKPKIYFGSNNKNNFKSYKKTNFNRFSSMEVENKIKEITPLYKKGHAVSHDKQKSSKKENKKIKNIYLKKNLAHNMAEKKIKENSLKNKAPVRSQKNWAKGNSKDTLKKMIQEGTRLSDCKFKLVLMYGLNPRGQHQSRDTWAALMEIETKDLPLLKRMPDSDVFLLMVRENVCQKAIKNFKESFKEIHICEDMSEFSDFLNFNRKIVLDELLRLSKTHAKFIPLANACKYIKKKINKEIADYGDFLYLGKMMGEPARKNKDFNNE
ncbi:hypothetical protein AAJ76_6800017741 [Vairimorpha ceranae]|uniref:Uncharacterized protein n=1 Tax=Vairimorpha ceranae TaxID=40302 RepID=A0A0F9YP72_9MICR|nr:hypothetical protein AAJ76_6800017741 [Vairimorpha ceranae]KKO74472.1 hypothetical protein AAJ76_6800017741 [Vairimorpha ceranae]